MTTQPFRSFEDKPASRIATPLFMGIAGVSGSGKTYSALRIATGMQRVVGGDIFVLDTEKGRALHYAEAFKFRHVAFDAPFGPLDYLAALEHCVKKGAKVVVADSGSHEHEGPGGVLEQHQAEVERLSKGDPDKAERVKMLAWAKPKAARRRLLNAVGQLPINLIMCFRAKEKLKIQKGQEPKELGFMPIAGDDFVYEMMLKALLMPGAGGVPTWITQLPGEQMMVKLPEQFRWLQDVKEPLSEDTGEQLARWAAGSSMKDAPTAAQLLDRYKEATDAKAASAVTKDVRAWWSKYSTEERELLNAAAAVVKERLNPKKNDANADPDADGR